MTVAVNRVERVARARSPRGASLLALSLCLLGALTPGAARGQEPAGPAPLDPAPVSSRSRAEAQLHVEVEAARVELLRRPSAQGEERDVAVYLPDETMDVRAQGRRLVTRSGRAPVRQRFEVRAEALAAFLLPISPGEGGLVGLPVTGLYARGYVRVVVETDQVGRYVIEAEEVFLDFRRERAYVREGIVRARAGQGGGILGASRFVVAAERLRAEGSGRIVAENASATVCAYTRPLWAIGAERIEVAPSEPPPPLPAALAALGGLAGASSAGLRGGRGRLMAQAAGGGAQGPLAQRWRPLAGSDAILRGTTPGYRLGAEGIHLRLLPPGVGLSEPLQTPRIPFLGWDTGWPLPTFRVGSSSRLGTFATLGLKSELTRLRGDSFGELRIGGEGRAEYFERRGTGGALGVDWTRREGGERKSEGFLRAYGIRDRADEDRVGSAIRNEGRFWLRGLARERLPGQLQLDAEVSRISDRGMLLEYFRNVAQTEKEQETYAYLRGAWDDLGVRLIGRTRINDWQTQLERTPEARLDWILHPIVVEPDWGGLYLDVASRAGHLRLRPADATGLPSYRAWRADLQTTLSAKTSLGPFQLRGYAGVRETAWSERIDEQHSVDRFAALAGWNLSTVLWRRFSTPFGVLRHEIVPEAGTRHVFGVTTEPEALLAFDEVEQLRATDQVFLRLRTRLLTDSAARRRKLADLSVEAVYLMRDQGVDVGRSWLHLRYDLRLNLIDWFTLRGRAEQDINRGTLRDLSVSGTFSGTFLPGAFSDLQATVGYREIFTDRLKVEAINWGVTWKLTPAWGIALDQQYDFFSGEFLRHSGRVIRYFQGFAFEVSVSNDPQQDDTSVSFSVAPVFDAARDPFLGDRRAQLYPN